MTKNDSFIWAVLAQKGVNGKADILAVFHTEAEAEKFAQEFADDDRFDDIAVIGHIVSQAAADEIAFYNNVDDDILDDTDVCSACGNTYCL